MTTAPPSARRVGPRSIQSVASSSQDKSVLTPRLSPAKPVTLPNRLLFPTLPADADLPPLLVSPAATPELNAELYEFIALALRAYVNPWWTKITRYDKEFLPEITRILTSVLRALEARVAATDFSPLVYRDLPTLLNQHWTDYRNAQSKLHTSYATGGAATLPQLFHQMQPHMAVSAEGVIDIVYVRQAVDHILKACLPPEDYEPETERYIVREVILKVLVASVLPRITQPWFIHKTILDLMGSEKPMDHAEEPAVTHDDGAPSERPALQRRSSHHLSFQALAIFFLSAVQSVSGISLSMLHAYRQARETIRKVNRSKDSLTAEEHRGVKRPDHEDLDGLESKTGLHARIPTTPSLPGSLSMPQKSPLVVAPTPPSPSSDTTSFMSPPSQMSSSPPSHGITPSSSPSRTPVPAPPQSAPPPPPIPNYTLPPLTFLLTLMTPPPIPPSPSSPSPSPYISTSSVAHATHATARALAHLLTLLASLAAPFLARLLPYLLYAHVLCAPTLATIVRAARRALFPEGWPATPPPDPTPEEQAELRVRLGRRLTAAVPGALAPLLGPTPAARAAAVDAAVAPLDSQPCNAHLAVFVLDLVLLTVFPEMGVSEEG